MSNKSGSLYIVATPIGNLQDLSPRAVATLQQASLILAEDTRHSRTLMQAYSISTPLKSCHEHNEEQQIEAVIARISSGEDLALISDAGTPLICDPGYRLVAEASRAGIKVIPIPGPSACITALSASGLPSDRFFFQGYLPSKSVARRKTLQAIAGETATVIFYEVPHRIQASLADAIATLGDDRPATLVRELTKKFEEIHSGSLQSCQAWLNEKAERSKGEFVFLIGGVAAVEPEMIEAERILKILMQDLPKRQAADLTAQITGAKKNVLYQRALDLDQ